MTHGLVIVDIQDPWLDVAWLLCWPFWLIKVWLEKSIRGWRTSAFHNTSKSLKWAMRQYVGTAAAKSITDVGGLRVCHNVGMMNANPLCWVNADVNELFSPWLHPNVTPPAFGLNYIPAICTVHCHRRYDIALVTMALYADIMPSGWIFAPLPRRWFKAFQFNRIIVGKRIIAFNQTHSADFYIFYRFA